MAAAGVDALIAPKAFKSKDKDPETLLIDFDLYIKTIKKLLHCNWERCSQQQAESGALTGSGGPGHGGHGGGGGEGGLSGRAS